MSRVLLSACLACNARYAPSANKSCGSVTRLSTNYYHNLTQYLFMNSYAFAAAFFILLLGLSVYIRQSGMVKSLNRVGAALAESAMERNNRFASRLLSFFVVLFSVAVCYLLFNAAFRVETPGAMDGPATVAAYQLRWVIRGFWLFSAFGGLATFVTGVILGEIPSSRITREAVSNLHRCE